MRVPEKYYDEVFDFKGQWDVPSRCGLRILRQQGKTTVIVTELYQDNPGTSVTAAGKALAEQICRDKGLNLGEITYLECNPDTHSKLSFYDEEFFEVDFSGDPKPVYRQLSAPEVKKLSFPQGLE
jgi:hypothetical protein